MKYCFQNPNFIQFACYHVVLFNAFYAFIIILLKFHMLLFNFSVVLKTLVRKPQLRKSAVWMYFEDTEEPKRSKCNLCGKIVDRYAFGTSKMRCHLKSEHPSEYLTIL